jgi:hypothetical protein
MQRVTALPANYKKDLNLAPSYASNFDPGLRELLQNHADQCK